MYNRPNPAVAFQGFWCNYYYKNMFYLKTFPIEHSDILVDVKFALQEASVDEISVYDSFSTS